MQDLRQIKLEPSWVEVLSSQFDLPYMQAVREFLEQEKAAGKTIFPPSEQIFGAFNAVSFDKVKVVILGQDPYHGAGQAHGLCFSVPEGIRIPPSLLNMYKELNRDLGKEIPSGGNLQHWADQGVLLLNSVLTVEQGVAASHQLQGWEIFTDKVIEALNQRTENLVFLLWGNYAQKKGGMIDGTKHLVLKTTHPSPLSAHRGFLGCGHFSKANEYLVAHGKEPIDW